MRILRTRDSRCMEISETMLFRDQTSSVSRISQVFAKLTELKKNTDVLLYPSLDNLAELVHDKRKYICAHT